MTLRARRGPSIARAVACSAGSASTQYCYSGSCAASETSARQVRRSHQELVDRVRRLAPFANRPDNKGLATPHVAGSEYLRHRRPVRRGVSADIAALVKRHAEGLEHPFVHRMHEPHREQHQVSLDLKFSAGGRLELGIDVDAVEFLYVA